MSLVLERDVMPHPFVMTAEADHSRIDRRSSLTAVKTSDGVCVCTCSLCRYLYRLTVVSAKQQCFPCYLFNKHLHMNKKQYKKYLYCSCHHFYWHSQFLFIHYIYLWTHVQLWLWTLPWGNSFVWSFWEWCWNSVNTLIIFRGELTIPSTSRECCV